MITFVAQAFRVQGTSMQPLLADGERIVVNKFLYRFEAIQRGDVVVFWYPRDPPVSFIKRVVGVPGDVVELRSGVLYVNGVRVEEDFLKPAFRDSRFLPAGGGREGLLLRPRRSPEQQQRQPELGRGPREVHLRQGRVPLLALLARSASSTESRRRRLTLVSRAGDARCLPAPSVRWAMAVVEAQRAGEAGSRTTSSARRRRGPPWRRSPRPRRLRGRGMIRTREIVRRPSLPRSSAATSGPAMTC